MATEEISMSKSYQGTQSDFDAITDLSIYHPGDTYSIYDTVTNKFIKYYRFAGGHWREL
jgi:hypothetical protein